MSGCEPRWRYGVIVCFAIGLAAGGVSQAQPAPSEEQSATEQERERPEGGRPGWGRHKGPDSRRGRFFERIPEEERAKVREFIEEHFPRLASEMRDLETLNPDLFRQRIRDVMPRVLRLMRELDKDEKLGRLGIKEERLEIEIQQVARKYFDASEEQQQADLRAEIEDLIGRQFDVRQKRTERMIELLEKRLTRLKRQAHARSGQRDESIARDVELLLSSPPGSQVRSRHHGRPHGKKLHPMVGEQEKKTRPE